LHYLHKDLDSLDWINAKHSGILKKVCFIGEEFKSNITQVAYTELKQGNEVNAHIHTSMEEIFFLIEGICEFKIEGDLIFAKKQSIIRIPVHKEHSLHAISDCKFFYFWSINLN
jgi:quercetin dioxygenase-like cupin family protein